MQRMRGIVNVTDSKRREFSARNNVCNRIEQARLRYRPTDLVILFVAEAPPADLTLFLLRTSRSSQLAIPSHDACPIRGRQRHGSEGAPASQVGILTADKSMTREQRSQQLWSILVLTARNRQILTYEMIGQACGVPAPSVGDFLRPIQQYCVENELAPLTSIVVNKSTGIPGEGFIAAHDVPRAHIDVFAANWLEQAVPSANQFADAYARAPDRR